MHVEDILMQTSENKQADVNIGTLVSILNADQNTLGLRSSPWTRTNSHRNLSGTCGKNPQSKQSWDELHEIRPYKTKKHMHRNNEERA